MQEEYDKLLPNYEVFQTMSEAEKRKIRAKIEAWKEKLALVKKEEEKIRAEKPTYPSGTMQGRKN